MVTDLSMKNPDIGNTELKSTVACNMCSMSGWSDYGNYSNEELKTLAQTKARIRFRYEGVCVIRTAQHHV